VGLSALTFSDDRNGQRFQRWVDEFVYAIGTNCDFAEIVSPTKYEMVIALICLPSHLAGFGKDGISLKRADHELWSTKNVNFDEFVSGDPARMISCINTAFREAVDQIPDRHLADVKKREVRAASDKAVQSLMADPSRYPR
jgi:hypothetical protein